MKKYTVDREHFILEGFALSFLVAPPVTTSPVKKALILMHGVGGNENNLFAFASLVPDFMLICPRGPYEMGPGSFGWFSVNFSTGRPVIDAAQEAHSRATLELFLDQVREKYGVTEIRVGGFSQGATMAYSLGLLHPEKITAAYAFSGRILPEIMPLVNVQGEVAFKDLNVSVAHGIYDQKLGIDYARDARDYLLTLGVKLKYHEFETGHQLTPAMFGEMLSPGPV